jgi:hypothetical protein
MPVTHEVEGNTVPKVSFSGNRRRAKLNRKQRRSLAAQLRRARKR